MKTSKKLRGGLISIELQIAGNGEPLLFLHGAGGLMGVDPFIEELGRDFRVIAPHLPGYGESTGAELIDDVIDAALVCHELMDELGVPSANIMGHSMGGMIAAELAALDVHRAKKLVLAAPAGFWLDELPIPDFFAAQLDELPGLLFHDTNSPLAAAFTQVPDDPQALAAMYLERTKRLAMASKFLWPIPERGLKKRIWRIKAPTLILWGESDRMIPPAYAKEFMNSIAASRLKVIPKAGHMLMYEQPEAFCSAARTFLQA